MRLAPFLILALAACGGLREDRSITWSPAGDAVTFQHGDDGVYVADRDGKNLRRIHKPDEKVVATSTPLWAPAGDRLIFTTARTEDEHGLDPRFSRLLQLASDPAGDVFFQVPAIYTCWLKTDGEPRALFEAKVGHVGYVAANLAVRWHPSGKRIVCIRADGDGEHGLFEFDLESKEFSRVLDREFEPVAFHFSPDGKHLTVVLENGIWVDGWHIPVAYDEKASLESRRASRPAWKPDSSGFAFATPASLRFADTKTRQVEDLAAGEFSDLQWHPGGARLGAVRKEALHIVAGGETTRIPTRPVRRFVGWNRAGDRFAYVAPDRIRNVPKENWALLLPPEPRARDAVYVSGGEADHEVFSGLRATFPRWSPKENRLSVWFTFAPTHRSALSRLLGWGLRSGDPAAIFEPETGAIRWMTVNAFEDAQVGHYRLLKRDYKEAWTWYENAAQGETAARGQPREFPFFQYICLRALGRQDDAAKKLARFRKDFLPPQDFVGAMAQPDTPAGNLLRDLYAAEVFLSLDRIEEAEAFFADRPLILGQLYLLQRKYAAYVALEVPEPVEDQVLGLASMFAWLPLLCQEFLAKLDEGDLKKLLARQPETEFGNLVRRACYLRLGLEDRAKAVPLGEQPGWFPEDLDFDGMVKQLREFLAREW